MQIPCDVLEFIERTGHQAFHALIERDGAGAIARIRELIRQSQPLDPAEEVRRRRAAKPRVRLGERPPGRR